MPCLIFSNAGAIYEIYAGAYHRSFILGRRHRGVWTCRGCVRKRCQEKKKDDAAILPCGVFELGARIRRHRLVTSCIRAFDIFLSSMRHHQVLCVLSISCLHAVRVLSACCLRFISLGSPSKPVIHSSLVKNRLSIDYNIVVHACLCCVARCVPNKSG